MGLRIISWLMGLGCCYNIYVGLTRAFGLSHEVSLALTVLAELCVIPNYHRRYGLEQEKTHEEEGRPRTF